MLNLPSYRYALDRTGKNPDNLVSGEIHRLSSNPLRVIATRYGGFYTKSVRIFDTATNEKLVYKKDYMFGEINQDATVLYGNEIAHIIIITNKDISSVVSVEYQVVGGPHTNDNTAIKNMYEAVLKDNREVLWENVLEKPIEYPPMVHAQMLSTLYGFEPLIGALERLGNSITLTNVPAFEYLIEWLKAELKKFELSDLMQHIKRVDNPHKTTKDQVGLGDVENLPVVTEQEIEDQNPVRKYVTFDMLLMLLATYVSNASYRFVSKALKVKEGRTLLVEIITTNVDNNTTMYWTIDHLTTNEVDFPQNHGVVRIQDNKGSFYLNITKDKDAEPNETFRIKLRKKSVTGVVVAISDEITILDVDPNAKDDAWFDAYQACCLNELDIAFDLEKRWITGNKFPSEYFRRLDIKKSNKPNVISLDTYSQCCLNHDKIAFDALKRYVVYGSKDIILREIKNAKR